jgi:hypothetical protein
MYIDILRIFLFRNVLREFFNFKLHTVQNYSTYH